MKLLTPVACFTALALSACSRAARPPDVVILLADDLGWADVGYHACDPSGAIATPRIDALARAGLRLERYYTAPLCTPARAGLLTGRSPLRLGLLRNLASSDQGGLPADEPILPRAFRDAGYATAMVGKWHLGHARPEQGPNARGFESFYGLLGGWVDYATHERDGALDWQRDGEPLREEGYSTRLLAREAVRVLAERDRSRPIFLYVAFNAPHAPLHVPPGRSLDEAGGGDPARRVYAWMVSELDHAVGEILDEIEREGTARDTLVFFASDNGADPRYGGSNAPLRGGKTTVFEGGVRAPAILAWPGHIAPGESTQLVTHLDALPTLAGAAGMRLAGVRPLDGVDLWKDLRSGARASRTAQFFGCERPDELRYGVVDPPWKLVLTVERGGGQPRDHLFDIENDPIEAKDLAADHPEVVRGLRSALEPWRAMPLTLPPLASER